MSKPNLKLIVNPDFKKPDGPTEPPKHVTPWLETIALLLFVGLMVAALGAKGAECDALPSMVRDCQRD